VVVLAGAGTAIALTGMGPQVESSEVFTHHVTAVTIDAGAGDVTIRTGARADTVEVTRRARGSLSDSPSARGTWEATTLVIRPECPDSCGADYEIRLPDGVGVTAETGSGDIELDGALGSVSLEAGSGDVDADVAVDNLATHTGSGDMELRLRSAPTQLTATSGSGDVEIRVPRNQTYDVAVQSGSGDTEVNVPQQGAAAHRIQVRTGSGDISLRSR
jgi:Putative adhesin